MNDDRTLTSRELPCKISRDEAARYGQLLSAKVRERDLVDEERRSKASEYTARMKAISAEITRLAVAVDKGEEIRPVDCYTEFHAGTIRTIRVDTGEVVTVRPATQAERQTAISAPHMDAPHASSFPDLDDEEREDRVARVSIVRASLGDAVAHMPDDFDPADDDTFAPHDGAGEHELDAIDHPLDAPPPPPKKQRKPRKKAAP
jgi:hypothetical protein